MASCLPQRLRCRSFGLLGRDKGRSSPLFRSLTDPECVTHLTQLGLGFAEPGLEFTRPRTQLGVLHSKGLQLAAQCVGERDVLLRALTCLRRIARGELGTTAGRRLTDLQNDRVQQNGGQATKDQVDDDNKTGADARHESKDRQGGGSGNETGSDKAPARTRRPVQLVGLLVGLALGYSGTHVIHGKN